MYSFLLFTINYLLLNYGTHFIENYIILLLFIFQVPPFGLCKPNKSNNHCFGQQQQGQQPQPQPQQQQQQQQQQSDAQHEQQLNYLFRRLDKKSGTVVPLGSAHAQAYPPRGDGKNGVSAADVDVEWSLNMLYHEAGELHGTAVNVDGEQDVPLYNILGDISAVPKWFQKSLKWKQQSEFVEYFLSIGGEKTGLSFHSHENAWNGLIWGTKQWLLYQNDNEANDAFLKKWNDNGQQRDDFLKNIWPFLPKKQRPLECYQEKGDLIYIPDGTLHAVWNKGEVVSVSSINHQQLEEQEKQQEKQTVPTSERKEQGMKLSPLEIINSRAIPFAHFSVPIQEEALNSACGCATNYSAAWDRQGKLVVYVVDNFLCPETLRHVLEIAHSSAETYWEDARASSIRLDDFLDDNQQRSKFEKESQEVLAKESVKEPAKEPVKEENETQTKTKNKSKRRLKYDGIYPGIVGTPHYYKVDKILNQCLDYHLNIIKKTREERRWEKKREARMLQRREEIIKKKRKSPIKLFAAPYVPPTLSRIETFFHQWDVNQNGVLSLQEIMSALRERTTSNLLHGIEKIKISEYLEQAHSNFHDINIEEFNTIIESGGETKDVLQTTAPNDCYFGVVSAPPVSFVAR